jgi:predicted metal-dependent phosphoesterase TrpH
MTVAQGIRAAVEAGLDGIVLTEHNTLWDDQEIAGFRRKLPSKFKLFVGTEVNCAENHFLVYGIKSLQKIRYGLPAAELVGIAHGDGAAVVAAHPYRWHRWQGDCSYELDVDGVEIESTNTSPSARRLAERLARDKGIPGIVASDAHSIEAVGKYWQPVPDGLESVHDLAALLKGS